MKGSEGFKAAIQSHLEARAASDPLFAETFKKPAKNIDDCVNYILAEVQKSGQNGFADDEIFGMAAHYYDEDDIKPAKASGNARVVVNRHAEGAKKPATQTLKEPKKKPVPGKPAAQQSYLF